MGEVDAAFGLGRKGFEIILGPGGKGGHGLTDPGIDILAYNPKSGALWIVDNKASGGTSTVQSADAITKNLAVNIERASVAIQKLPDFPNKAVVLEKLAAAKGSIAAKQKLPVDVSVVVTNAGGYHSGVSKKLKAQGIKFEDLTGASTQATRKADVKTARNLGSTPGRPTTYEPAHGPEPAVGNLRPRTGAVTPDGEELSEASRVRGNAKVAASSIAKESKILRGARYLGVVLQGLGAVGSVLDFFHFTAMARSKLAGGAFIHGETLTRVNRMLARAKMLPGKYARLSEAMYEMNDSLQRALKDRASAAAAGFSILGLYMDVWQLRANIRRRKELIDKFERDVKARKMAATRVLEEPATFGAIGFGSSILAEVFAAQQDLEQIEGVLSDVSEELGGLIPTLEDDVSYLEDWLKVLGSVALGGYSP